VKLSGDSTISGNIAVDGELSCNDVKINGQQLTAIGIYSNEISNPRSNTVPTAQAVKDYISEYAVPLTAFGDAETAIKEVNNIKGLLNDKNLVVYVDNSSSYTHNSNYVLSKYSDSEIGAYLLKADGSADISGG